MRRALCRSLSVVLVVPMVAAAQVTIALGGGPSVQNSEGFSAGYNVQAALSPHIPAGAVGLRVDGTFEHFAAKSDASVSSGSWSVTGASLAAVIGGNGTVGPY